MTRPARCAVGRIRMLALVLSLFAGGLRAEPIEYQVKAAFLYNFARYVTWPASKLAENPRVARFCVLEQDPIAPTLESLLANKKIDDLSIAVRRVSRVEEFRDCQLAYLGALAPERTSAVLSALAGSNTLTVFEGPAAATGGAIRLYLEDRTIHFEVNVAAVERERLEVSSHLMSVAKVVRR